MKVRASKLLVRPSTQCGRFVLQETSRENDRSPDIECRHWPTPALQLRVHGEAGPRESNRRASENRGVKVIEIFSIESIGWNLGVRRCIAAFHSFYRSKMERTKNPKRRFIVALQGLNPTRN
jgi:hypothetical protein